MLLSDFLIVMVVLLIFGNSVAWIWAIKAMSNAIWRVAGAVGMVLTLALLFFFLGALARVNKDISSRSEVAHSQALRI